MRRRVFLGIAAAAAVVPLRGFADGVTLDAAARAYRVVPGGSIQAPLEAASITWSTGRGR